MEINLQEKNGSYCGSVRSYSHNERTGFTTIVFVGSIVKRFQDINRTAVNFIDDMKGKRVNYFVMKIKFEVFNGYEKGAK